MPATYEPIATITLGSAASNIEFTSIPGAFTDLVCVLVGRTDRTATVDEAVAFRVGNGSVDTGSNYSLTNILGTGSAALSQRASSQTSAEWGVIATSTSSNTTPSVAILHLMSYANTNVFKTALGASARSEGAAVGRYVSLWRSTSAITNLRLIPVLGPNFVSGTTASLYGIKAA